jgi:type 1 glutamine amidotransferase
MNEENKTMREALIVWGGWSGHEPQECAHVIRDMLGSGPVKIVAMFCFF